MIKFDSDNDAVAPTMSLSLLEQFSTFAFGSARNESDEAEGAKPETPHPSSPPSSTLTTGNELTIVSLMTQGQLWTWSITIPAMQALGTQ